MSWCKLSAIRKKQIESQYDITFTKVFCPIYLEKLSNINNKKIMEIGCGTGHLAKELLDNLEFKNYIALESSLGMYEQAEKILKPYQNVNLKYGFIKDLEKSSVNIVLSHLVFHVVDDLNSLLAEMFQYMEERSQLIFSIPHPCFYNEYKEIFNDDEYLYIEEIKKDTIFKISNDNSIDIKVPYIHRPISYYINILSKNGFNLIELEEIFPDKSIQSLYPELWKNPRYCIFYVEKTV